MPSKLKKKKKMLLFPPSYWNIFFTLVQSIGLRNFFLKYRKKRLRIKKVAP
jgi:hypothetical protein